jgi:hypothetical protein
VPVRVVPVVLAAMLNVTAPMPDPVAPAVTVIHGVVVVAVHGQDVPVMTLSVRLLAVASTAKLTGVTVEAQPVAACVTVTVWPAAVNVPVRGLPVAFCAMENVTEPIPEPLAPDVIVIHGVVVVAVHGQDVPETTLNVRLVAIASTAKLLTDTVPMQPVAACVTVTVWPATVNVPVRGLPVAFCAMENETAPMPEPVAPDVIVSHEVVVVAVHEQEVPAMTLSVRLLAVASTAKLVTDTVPVQPTVPCVTVTGWPATVTVPTR